MKNWYYDPYYEISRQVWLIEGKKGSYPNAYGAGSKRYIKAGSSGQSASQVCKNGGNVRLGKEDGFDIYDLTPPNTYTWKFIPENNNKFFRIRLDGDYCAGKGHYYLSTSNFSCNRGTTVMFKPWDSSSSNNRKQKWEVQNVYPFNGYLKFKLEGCSDRYLTIDSGLNQEDQKLIIWTSTGDHQEWRMRPSPCVAPPTMAPGNACFASNPYYWNVDNDVCRKYDQGCTSAGDNSRCCTGQ